MGRLSALTTMLLAVVGGDISAPLTDKQRIVSYERFDLTVSLPGVRDLRGATESSVAFFPNSLDINRT